MAPLVKLLGAGSLIAGLVAAITSRLTRRKRKAEPCDSAVCSKDAAIQDSPRSQAAEAATSSTGASHGEPLAPEATWCTSGLSQRTQHRRQPGATERQSPSRSGGEARSSEWQLPSQQQHQQQSSTSSGLFSRLLGAGRASESLESAVSYSETAGSSTQGGEEYDSSEEQEAESCAESRSGYGKSDRARLVDLWIESALLVSRDVRLDKRHFDRTTRQNLKKMRPASAQLILSEIADRSWDATPDIAKEIHRLVSHAKAQDKFAAVPSGGSSSSGVQQAGAAASAAATAAVTSLLSSRSRRSSGAGAGSGMGLGVGVGVGVGVPVPGIGTAAAAAAGGPAGGAGLTAGSMRLALL